MSRTNINLFLEKYPREILEDLYFNKYNRHLGKMSEALNIYQDTLSKIFKKLNIIQKPHHPSEYVEVRQILSVKAKERAKICNPIINIVNTPNWREKSDQSRIKNGTARRPHLKNRKVLGFTDEELKRLVLFHGVQKLARTLNCSPSTIYRSCQRRNIKLSRGPSKEKRNDPEFHVMCQKRSVNSFANMKTMNTSIEIALQKELEKLQILFRTHVPIINLTVPDIYIEPNIVIYADGDYWHNRPETQNRDRYVNRGLEKAGYKVFRFWEHEIKADVSKCVQQVVNYVNSLKK